MDDKNWINLKIESERIPRGLFIQKFKKYFGNTPQNARNAKTKT